MSARRRPQSITFTCMFLLVASAITMFSIPGARADEQLMAALAAGFSLPIEIQLTTLVVAALVNVACAGAMLGGRRIGRTILTGFYVAAFVMFVIAATNKLSLLPIYAIGGLILTVLHRPPARRYFDGQLDEVPDTGDAR